MPDYKKAARRAAEKYGVNPAIFSAMINAESGFNPSAGSPAGARGIAQFMPATARAYGVNLDDGRVTDDLEGAARYLRDNLAKTKGDYRKALSIYNSGKPDKYLPGGYPETIAYVKKIMGEAGQAAGDRSSGTGGDTGGSVTPSSSAEGTAAGGQAQQALSFLASRRSGTAAELLTAAATAVGETPESFVSPKTQNPKTQKSSGSGNYKVQSGANREGAPLSADMRQFLKEMTASGRSVTVTTGSNHGRMTSTGNVSDHWSGNGVDIGSSANGFPETGGGVGDLIAAHAIKRASGKSWGESLKLARQGGAFTFNKGGKRTQVIWKSNVGGNHYNHVHIGRG